jgi:hypothetical protein
MTSHGLRSNTDFPSRTPMGVLTHQISCRDGTAMLPMNRAMFVPQFRGSLTRRLCPRPVPDRRRDKRRPYARPAPQPLEVGRGRYADTAQGEAARDLNTARNRRREAERFAETSDTRRTRRHWRHDAKEWADREVKAQTAYDEVVVPEATRLDHHIDEMDDHMKELRQLQADRTSWLREHPEVASRLDAIEGELNPLSDMPTIHQELSRLLTRRRGPELHRGIDHGPDLGIDIGL